MAALHTDAVTRTAPIYDRVKRVIAYVNTSTAVKAESDICCTSSNALAVVESFGTDHVIMLPDEYLAQNIATQTKVRITAWKGHCEVHERFTRDDIRQIRENHPG